MSNPNALYLLADHIKLSLLERQRSKARTGPSDNDADADNDNDNDNDNDAQGGHIARSLEQLRDGLAALQRERARLGGNDNGDGDAAKAQALGDALPALQKKLDSLNKQFAAQNKAAASTSKPAKPDVNKPLPLAGDMHVDLEAQRANLFQRPYSDDPDEPAADAGYADHDNVQLHQMHARIIEDQDAQLDALGVSIGRQRELSMQIGEELDSQVALIEESERVVDRHQGRLDRARGQLGKISRSSSGDCKQMGIIIALIVILVLLIAILK